MLDQVPEMRYVHSAAAEEAEDAPNPGVVEAPPPVLGSASAATAVPVALAVPTGAVSATYPAWSRAAGTPDEPGPSPAELSYDAALFVLPVAQPYDENLAPLSQVQRTPDEALSALSGFPGDLGAMDEG